MQNGRINSPKLRPRLSSSENRNRKTCPHALREREVSIKTKYGHRSIMLIIITATKLNIRLLALNFYHILLMNK